MRERLDRWLDPVLAVLVFGLSVPPLLRSSAECGCPVVPPWAYVLLVAECLPLAVRRRWPFATALAGGAVTAAYGVTWLPEPVMPYAGLVGLYTVAAHGSRRTALAAAGTAAGAIALAMLLDPAADYQDVLVTYLLFATAWLLGNSARQRRERVADAEARAAALERTRAVQAARAVVEERNRIARELHDVVAHHVSMMVVQAEAGPVAVGRDPDRVIETFDTISATGRQALAEMRRLLGVLRSDDADRLAPQPGTDRIPELVDGVRAAGLDVSLEVAGRPGPLPPAVDLSAYRLLQEALTNALRHAGPARVTARVAYRADAVEIDVVDDGRGGPPAGEGGHGLVAMRERVGLLGGSVAAGPEPGGGWAVRARLPVGGAAR